MEPIDIVIIAAVVLLLGVGEYVFSTFDNRKLIYLLPGMFVFLSLFSVIYFYQFTDTTQMSTLDQVLDVAELLIYTNIPTVLLVAEGRWLLKVKDGRQAKLGNKMKPRK